MPPLNRRAGFVLPLALMVMVVVSIVASTALYSARSDFRAARAARHAAVAMAAADAGAVRTMAQWDTVVTTLPDPGDSLDLGWEALPDRSQYRVVLYRTPVDSVDPPPSSVVMYVTGIAPPPAVGRRTVGVVLEPGLGSVDVCCDAAVEVTSPLTVTGTLLIDPVPEVDGDDQTPLTWLGVTCPVGGDQAGAAAPSAGDVQEGVNGDIDGVPDVRADATLTAAGFMDFGGGVTYSALAAAATNTFVGDQVLSPLPVLSGLDCDIDEPTNWGDPLAPLLVCGDHLPVIHVAGDLDLTGGVGQGVLLVDGDLTIGGAAEFYGVVIVLGTVDVRGLAQVYGGIKARGGATGAETSLVREEAKVQYSSCAISRAQDAVGGGAATELAWFEVIG